MKVFLSRIALAIGILGLVACVALGLAAFALHRYANTPVLADAPARVFVVARGESFIAAANRLEQEGIILRAGWFSFLARLKKMDSSIRAGEYALSASMSPNRVLEVLVEGKTLLHRLTVVEGATLVQIALAVEDGSWASAEDFMKAAASRQLMALAGAEGDNLEGYLFPDTYFFPRTHGADGIALAMTKRFMEVFDAARRERAAQLGMSVHEVVTLASIIEKEAGCPQEYKIISSVFHNRLKKGMRLQADPTVIYGLQTLEGRLRRVHLETYTPYNTYIIRGLPPGPICNPGQGALDAALYPDETEYLYFVSKNDGTHHFSKNLVEHNRAVNLYQRSGRGLRP
ncbi:MAG: endolytic transglycosylase MltG [Desulfatibacillaceae bacterium]|nr:endolytic transglycosylase MltG [Desulfatibacillaceae bacterium]